MEIQDQDGQEQQEQQDVTSQEYINNTKYKDGDILKFVRVRFPGNAKSFQYHVGDKEYAYGQKVVAMSDRGMAIGHVNSFPFDAPFSTSLLPLQYISKVAMEEDIIEEKKLIESERQAERVCLDLIERHQLDMNLTHVEFTQYGKKAVFYFTSPGRVDFRGLVKDLVSGLKMRIELRQISVRDRAAAIGGIGPCGRVFCCSSFLNKYGQVGIKMAKNQGVALSGNKINGPCDQLKCCLQYEDQVYTDKRNRLPKQGSIIKTSNGDVGKVLNLSILNEQFVLLTSSGTKRRYEAAMYSRKESSQPLNFPAIFDNITDETTTLIKAPRLEVDTQTEQTPITVEMAQPIDNTVLDIENENDNDNDNENESEPEATTNTGKEKGPEKEERNSREKHFNKNHRNKNKFKKNNHQQNKKS